MASRESVTTEYCLRAYRLAMDKLDIVPSRKFKATVRPSANRGVLYCKLLTQEHHIYRLIPAIMPPQYQTDSLLRLDTTTRPMPRLRTTGSSILPSPMPSLSCSSQLETGSPRTKCVLATASRPRVAAQETIEEAIGTTNIVETVTVTGVATGDREAGAGIECVTETETTNTVAIDTGIEVQRDRGAEAGTAFALGTTTTVATERGTTGWTETVATAGGEGLTCCEIY
ncbi:hypothetical protein M427DRAFT_132522 [Gonapodya prolifera JEL478]|uniref:Uncharacterized protein n=1 Tax=Gonapodya prolifera (strain JEL478) TaxID=1344416 RepID=A0A139APH2_GONPJ|nr:hypothetical protein M427DRAFT_132522 [Gonapodya prolifera JEL478]|eukprot:KXS18544.1 hypothetical protein M427DRAFT_132522 [Gonapodya prolifera JEL478]